MKGRIKIWATQLLGNGDVSSHSHISSHPIPKIKAPLISLIPFLSRWLYYRFPVKLSTLKVMKKQRTQTSMTNPNSRWVMCTFFVNFKNNKKKCHNNTKIKIETTFFFNCDSKQTIGWVFFSLIAIGLIFLFFFLGIGNGILQRLVQHQPPCVRGDENWENQV